MMSKMKLRRMIPSALAAACVLGASIMGAPQADAAGTSPATSTYATIQPNAAGNAYIYTISWVAPDSGSAGGYTYMWSQAGGSTTNGGIGAGGSQLDNVLNLGGGNVDAVLGVDVNYRYGYLTRNDGTDTAPANTASDVGWSDPLNTTIGDRNPSSTTAKHQGSGDFTPWNYLAFGSGVQGVTGVYGDDPTGGNALAASDLGATHSGVGVATDENGGSDDRFGWFVSGFSDSDAADPQTPLTNTGYVQVIVPYPTSGVTSDAFTERFNPGTYTGVGALELVVTTDSSYIPKTAVAGDFDSDLDVDVSDVINAVGGFSGSGVTGNWYADGDMDADGDVDVSDVIGVVGAFTGSAAGTIGDTAGIPDLIYDPATGNVTLDGDGVTITAFQLESAGQFDDTAYVSPGGADLEEATASVLSYFVFSGGFTSADLGNVLPTGLDLTGLEALLSTADYAAGFGNDGVLDLVVAEGNPIPTPAALPAAFGLIGLLAARRRRAA